MNTRILNRRNFLKMVAASAAAAGLSHFRFLNATGPEVAFAETNHCNVQSPDVCNTGDPDVCVEPYPTGQGDLCPDGSPGGTDICAPPQELDSCDPPGGPTDICDPAGGGGLPADTCQPPNDPDQCEFTQPGPDTCQPQDQNPDVCPDGPGGDGDLCQIGVDPDTCEPYMQPPERDICDPQIDPVDVCEPTDAVKDANPTAVAVGSLRAKASGLSIGGAVAAVGGVVAAAGLAAALTRRREGASDEKLT